MHRIEFVLSEFPSTVRFAFVTEILFPCFPISNVLYNGSSNCKVCGISFDLISSVLIGAGAWGSFDTVLRLNVRDSSRYSYCWIYIVNVYFRSEIIF